MRSAARVMGMGLAAEVRWIAVRIGVVADLAMRLVDAFLPGLIVSRRLIVVRT